MVVEGHTNMRFAWQRKNSATDSDATSKGFTHPLNLVLIVYNIIWWIPIILPFTGAISYTHGFISFLAVTVIRLIANLVRNNVLRPAQAETFPLRSP